MTTTSWCVGPAAGSHTRQHIYLQTRLLAHFGPTSTGLTARRWVYQLRRQHKMLWTPEALLFLRQVSRFWYSRTGEVSILSGRTGLEIVKCLVREVRVVCL